MICKRTIQAFINRTLITACLVLSAPLSADTVKTVISLDLCTDWMLLKYADPAQVIAFSPLLYKYRADWVPANLPTHNGSLENLLSLEPALFISGEYNAILLRKRLVQLGKQVAVLTLPTSLDTIQQYHREFLSIINKNPSATPIDWNKTYPTKNQSLLLLGANGIGTGRNTLENDLLTNAGWRNYLSNSGYTALDMEQIIANPPDAIYWSAPTSQSLANLFIDHPAIRKITSNRELPEPQHWRWQCPGPWSLNLIEELSRWQNS